MKDSFGRTIDYLRISLTDRCNLRCIFCMPEEGVPLLSHEEILRIEEILAVTREMASMGLKRVRLTGGEPLLRRGLVDLVREMRSIPGIEEITLTTNGTLLKDLAEPLKKEGIKRLNIGLPSLDPERYRLITRRGDLNQALEGLQSAIEAGFNPIKLNTVLLKGLNDDPLPFLELTTHLEIEVRFIEYMPLGSIAQSELFLSKNELLKKISSITRVQETESPPGNGPARKYFRIPEGKGRFAFIAALSDHFCPNCNRLRLTADGHIRPCLFSDLEVDLKPALRPNFDSIALHLKILEALSRKPEEKSLLATQERFMAQIGG